MLAFAIVSALPAVDETVLGDIAEQDILSPADHAEFLKLKKLKKLLFG